MNTNVLEDGRKIKERPILFSGPMVRAILDGRKTQTRRVIKPQPAWKVANMDVRYNSESEVYLPYITDGKYKGWCTTPMWYCPYGQPGDRLWVRETFLYWSIGGGAGLYYKASDTDIPGPWKPSIFMKREYSRITLEITRIRVERLQDIENGDAMSEGVELPDAVRFAMRNGFGGGEFDAIDYSPIDDYRKLWESINGAGSWDINPWVWVLEFRRVEQ
jgi:hypothetical protein